MKLKQWQANVLCGLVIITSAGLASVLFVNWGVSLPKDAHISFWSVMWRFAGTMFLSASIGSTLCMLLQKAAGNKIHWGW